MSDAIEIEADKITEHVGAISDASYRLVHYEEGRCDVIEIPRNGKWKVVSSHSSVEVAKRWLKSYLTRWLNKPSE